MAARLITGGTVYTADAQESVHARGAVLIVDDTIAAVGPAADVERVAAGLAPEVRAGLRTTDASRMMVLPGFVNAHWHEMFAMGFTMRGALRPVSDRGTKWRSWAEAATCTRSPPPSTASTNSSRR